MRNLTCQLFMILLIGSSPALLSAEETEPQVKVDPSMYYRHLHLLPKKQSVFHKEEHQDSNQHLVGNLKIKAIESFDQFYLIEAGLRTKRSRFDDQLLEVRLEQAYLQSRIDDTHTFTAGKFEATEGPGAMVNPSDILNEDRRLYDSLYYRYGKIQMKWAAQMGNSNWSLTLLPRKGQEFQDGDALLRWAGQIGNAELSLKAKYSERDQLTQSAYASGFLTDSVGVYGEARYQARQRDVSEQREISFSDFDARSASGAGLIGLRYVVSAQRSLVGEYFYNQSGLSEQGFGDFFKFVSESRDADRETDDRLLGQQYAIFGYFDEKLFRQSALEMSSIYNVQDQSAFISLKLQRHFSRLTSIELNQLLYQGNQHTEFGEMPFSAITSIGFVGNF